VGGVCAGFVQSFVVSPVELAKTRLQIQADALASGKMTSSKYQSCMDCAKKIYQSEGVKGIFRGQTITVIREVPAFGTYFLTFEYLHRALSGDCGPSSLATLTAGGLAGIASWTICYPVDVIKTRLQSDGAFGRAEYKGMLDCLRQSVKTEGAGVLAKGLAPTVIRAFPSNAACFLVVSKVTSFIDGDNVSDDSSTSDTFKRIVSSGETILTAASSGQQILDYQKEVIKKVIFNHISNFLPIIQETLELYPNYSISFTSVGTEFFKTYCQKFTILTINEIYHML